MSAPDDVIWAEIWGDGKRFNSVSSYCDDSNVANGDECQGHRFYSMYVIFNVIKIAIIVTLFFSKRVNKKYSIYSILGIMFLFQFNS